MGRSTTAADSSSSSQIGTAPPLLTPLGRDQSSPSSAAFRSSRRRFASSKSVSWASSAYSQSSRTWLSATEMKPPSTAATQWPSSTVRTSTWPDASTDITGLWSAMIPISPARVRAFTTVASPDHTSRSAATRDTCIVLAIVRSSQALLDLVPLALDVVQTAAHEERLLGHVVVLAVSDLVERLDGLRHRDRRALEAGELLGHVGVLRQEPLDAARPRDDDLVLLGELVDTEDGDDVLQLLVALQDLLDPDRAVVVRLADVLGGQDPRRRGQRVDGRVDAERGDLARQLGGGVEVGERRGRRRVGVVVRRHVDRLHRGDRVTPGRGDPLLELAHLVGQVGLVAHRRGHPAQQGRHLGAGLGEPEDVVDEEQHVLVLLVAEVLRHRQRRQRDPQPGARRLVHLAEDQRRGLDDTRLGHLRDEVVALTRAL